MGRRPPVRTGHLPAPLPAQGAVDFEERVWFDREQVPAVVDHLRLQTAPGTEWGFNYNGERAWAIAEAGVNLSALVDEALAV
jgi:hypothetical protein